MREGRPREGEGGEAKGRRGRVRPREGEEGRACLELLEQGTLAEGVVADGGDGLLGAFLHERRHEQARRLGDAQARVREEAVEGAADAGDERHHVVEALGRRRLGVRVAEHKAEDL